MLGQHQASIEGGQCDCFSVYNVLWFSADHAPAVIRKKVEKKTHVEDLTGAISMSATDQLQLTDYVLKYYDDDDFEETTSRT